MSLKILFDGYIYNILLIIVEYTCVTCLKNFGNYKSHYTKHQNKKFPCKTKIILCTLINTNIPKFTHNSNINIKKENIANKQLYICEFCNHNFTKNSSLFRHLDGNCKIKKKNNIKTNTNKNSNNLEIKMNELIELNKQLVKQNDQIMKQNEEFKKELTETKNSKLINQKNINNIKIDNINNINNIKNDNIIIQINNYGSEKYEQMDNKLFLEPMIKEIGKQIFLKMIKNVYLNPELPENHNIVITDKNRQICKIYNNNRWITTDITTINNLLTRIIYFAKQKCEEYKNNPNQNDKIKSRLNTIAIK